MSLTMLLNYWKLSWSLKKFGNLWYLRIWFTLKSKRDHTKSFNRPPTHSWGNMRCFLPETSEAFLLESHPSINTSDFFYCYWVDALMECSHIFKCCSEDFFTKKKKVELHIFLRSDKSRFKRKSKILYEAHMALVLMFANKSLRASAYSSLMSDSLKYSVFITSGWGGITYNTCQTLFKWLNVWLVR